MVRTLDDANLDDVERELLGEIAEHGFQIVSIAARSREEPGWCFTVGLQHSYGHPELVLFGLPQDVGDAILAEAAADVADGARFAAGDVTNELLEGMPCTFATVVDRWVDPFLGTLRWYYAGEPFVALQCLWPDRNKRFPEDPAFEDRLRRLQPLLQHDDADAARVAHWLTTFVDDDDAAGGAAGES